MFRSFFLRKIDYTIILFLSLNHSLSFSLKVFQRMRERVLKCEESRYWLKLRQGKESKVVGRKEIKYGRGRGRA